ncbi:MAG: PP2C family protein-serine/threonine phosphatase [Planctomycetota bacterium]|jgi:serine phosphatase RsbU (regulator of sigma subunit)
MNRPASEHSLGKPRRPLADLPPVKGPVPPRWRNTLFFRLALVVNLSVVGVLGTFAFFDHQRHSKAHTANVVARLREEVGILRVAWAHSQDIAESQRFFDNFCRQMGAAVSPGHHIAVFNDAGNVILRAHERANPELEAKMAETGRTGEARFTFRGEAYVSSGLASGNRETIVVAQSLAPFEQIVEAQRASALASTGILVTLIFGITTIGFLVWVRDPLRELVKGVTAIGRGDFGVRVRPSGSSELRYLARRVNEMAQSLQGVERRRQAEMKRAREIQQGLLPANHRATQHFEMAGMFLPADSVGGDLYDVVELKDGSVLLATFDVSGHGVPAALYTALLRTVLRHQAATTANIARIAEAMNQELCGIGGHGEFATCFLAQLRNDGAEVEYVSAGHDPAIVVRGQGQTELLAGSDLVLGIERDTSYASRKSTLGSGDRLFLFTDGLHEVFGPNGRSLGRERLAGLLAETSKMPLERQLDVVLQRVRSFHGGGGFSDDVTLLAGRRK